MSAGSLKLFVRDSNRIEGLHHDPTPVEIGAHEDLLALPELRVADVENFVSKIQPGAKLRRRVGSNVCIAGTCPDCAGIQIDLVRCPTCKGSGRKVLHRPPPGGPEIEDHLAELLEELIVGHAWENHVEYETLHPFSDGNGRSGRAIWAWQMQQEGRDPFAIDVLRALYYQSLDWGRGQL